MAKEKLESTAFDIVIIGAGPVGLCFARNLIDSGLKIAVVEKQSAKSLATPAYDGREIALTHFSHHLLKDLGVLGLIPSDAISLIKNASVMNGQSSYAIHFDSRDTKKDNLGFMVSNQALRKAAYESVLKSSKIKLMAGAEVTNVESDQFCVSLTLSNGTTLTSSLAVAADSRFSPTRKMMNIPVTMKDFNRTCIVCRMEHDLPHDATAYECFHYGKTLAVLPLNNNHSSIVITLPSEKCDEVLRMSPKEFSDDISKKIKNRLGNMRLVSKLHSYPLVATYAQKFYARRFALIGDAAVGMHPVTAHGFNLGLRGQNALAKEIIAGRNAGMDIGTTEILHRYNKQHHTASRPIYLGTNALVNLYTKETLPARIARHALLRLGNNTMPAKRLIMDQLTDIKSL